MGSRDAILVKKYQKFAEKKEDFELYHRELSDIQISLQVASRNLPSVSPLLPQVENCLELVVERAKQYFDCDYYKKNLDSIIFLQNWARRIIQRARTVRRLNSVLKNARTSKNAEVSRSYQRFQIMKEILSTEKTYVDLLQKLEKIFIFPLRTNGFVAQKDIQEFEDNVHSILTCNSTLLARLLEAKLDPTIHEIPIGKIFTELAPSLYYYVPYIQGHDHSVAMVEKIRTDGGNSDFLNWIQEAEVIITNSQKKEQKAGGPFQSFAILPIQRVPRYVLLLDALLKVTPEDHVEYELIKDALVAVKKVAQTLNERKDSLEGSKRLIEISAELDAPFLELVEPNRRLLHTGYLYKCWESLDWRKWSLVVNRDGSSSSRTDKSKDGEHLKSRSSAPSEAPGASFTTNSPLGKFDFLGGITDSRRSSFNSSFRESEKQEFESPSSSPKMERLSAETPPGSPDSIASSPSPSPSPSPSLSPFPSPSPSPPHSPYRHPRRATGPSCTNEGMQPAPVRKDKTGLFDRLYFILTNDLLLFASPRLRLRSHDPKYHFISFFHVGPVWELIDYPSEYPKIPFTFKIAFGPKEFAFGCDSASEKRIWMDKIRGVIESQRQRLIEGKLVFPQNDSLRPAKHAGVVYRKETFFWSRQLIKYKGNTFYFFEDSGDHTDFIDCLPNVNGCFVDCAEKRLKRQYAVEFHRSDDKSVFLAFKTGQELSEWLHIWQRSGIQVKMSDFPQYAEDEHPPFFLEEMIKNDLENLKEKLIHERGLKSDDTEETGFRFLSEPLQLEESVSAKEKTQGEQNGGKDGQNEEEEKKGKEGDEDSKCDLKFFQKKMASLGVSVAAVSSVRAIEAEHKEG